jgi:hypothetical protein
MSETVHSRWWLGNALTVLLGGIALLGAGVNLAVGGKSWSSWFTVGFFYSSLGVGYLSIIPWYIDVRRIRESQAEYSPKAWLYALGYIVVSPILVSAVYLFNRSGEVGPDIRYRFTDATPPESSPPSREEPVEPRREPDNDTATPKQLAGMLVVLTALAFGFMGVIWFVAA